MTDRELTPAEEERVRRLLAQARHDEPMPPDVVARLDAALGDLAAERVVETPVVEHLAPVVDLAARTRRRRRATSLLVAAAAVTVIGVGVPPLLRGMTTGSSDSAGAGDAPKADMRTNGNAEPQRAEADALQGDAEKSASAHRLSVETFDQDVAALRELAADSLKVPEVAPSTTDGSYAATRCAGGVRQDAWGEGELLWVRYDGRRGALIFRAPEGDTQRVDLFLCGETAPTRSTVVPVP